MENMYFAYNSDSGCSSDILCIIEDGRGFYLDWDNTWKEDPCVLQWAKDRSRVREMLKEDLMMEKSVT